MVDSFDKDNEELDPEISVFRRILNVPISLLPDSLAAYKTAAENKLYARQLERQGLARKQQEEKQTAIEVSQLRVQMRELNIREREQFDGFLSKSITSENFNQLNEYLQKNYTKLNPYEQVAIGGKILKSTDPEVLKKLPTLSPENPIRESAEKHIVTRNAVEAFSWEENKPILQRMLSPDCFDFMNKMDSQTKERLLKAINNYDYRQMEEIFKSNPELGKEFINQCESHKPELGMAKPNVRRQVYEFLEKELADDSKALKELKELKQKDSDPNNKSPQLQRGDKLFSFAKNKDLEEKLKEHLSKKACILNPEIKPHVEISDKAQETSQNSRENTDNQKEILAKAAAKYPHLLATISVLEQPDKSVSNKPTKEEIAQTLQNSQMQVAANNAAVNSAAIPTNNQNLQNRPELGLGAS